MTDVTDRSLALLGLLAARSSWTGAELIDRLGITPRTLRRDVARLRAIGYRIDSTTGTAGGYRLAAGTRLPPLVFDDDEAVAIAALLGHAETNPIEGIGETAARALGKLGQVLPRRLRDRVAAIAAVSGSESLVGAGPRGQAPIDGEVLARLALAARDREEMGFGYRDRAGRVTRRRVEPHRVVTGYGWWYLVAYDLDRADWRTFRLDRIAEPTGLGQPFGDREPPGGARAYLNRSLASTPYRHRAVITLDATEEEIRSRVGYLLPSRIRLLADGRRRIEFGDDELSAVVRVVLALITPAVPYDLEASAEVREALRTAAADLLAHL
ncbi:helix-turn-helix transcriptional regulator [Microlunatus sp. GCM10028923]|uniref:helix-turn-helix transcriptional regulator n=1 Tax=Microlunatus sp. GCM10028923 TaxID=3273400 RepID=UPI0036170403